MTATRSRAVLLDDYLDVARTVPEWRALLERLDLDVVREHIADRTALLDRLAGADVVGVMRERTPLDRAVVDALPGLRLIVTSGMVNASIDLDAATRAAVLVCGTSSLVHPTVELTWGLILAAARAIPHHDRGI